MYDFWELGDTLMLLSIVIAALACGTILEFGID
jgi:hypothetical protein